MLPRLTLPPPPAALALIAVAFVLPGLAGHDLWKSQDALALGIVHDMAQSGDALVPRIAGTPWLYDPPLYHWFALAFGKIFQFLLEFHSAARLASGAFMLAALYLVHAAARDWAADESARRTSGAAALLLIIGAVGLVVRAHEALPELASLAAICGALAVLPHATRRPLHAGAAFGAALGFALLSATWIAPAALALAVILAHALCSEWRTRKAWPFLGAAALVAALIAASWPLALGWRSPEALAQWWALASRPHEPLANLRYFLSTGSWFAWPAWPLALWAAWTLSRRWREPRLFVPAVTTLIMLAGLALWAPSQDVNLVPLLAPLALLAAPGVFALRRGATAALDWFGILTFAFFGSLVWVGYIAMQTGLPPRLAGNFARSAPGFGAQFEVLPFAVALALTAAWLYLVLRTPPSPLRAVARWAAGMVLLWGSFAMLWMPWVDYQKSYRSVGLQLRSKIPLNTSCIAHRSLGMPQAAALDYHAGIRARPLDVLKPNACPLLLVQGSTQHEFDAPGAGWTKLADVGRPGDRSERFRLYRRGK
jgi:4-amino-4-deoxy-L-arabinose transferase-like glycosyltransferase